METVCIDIGNTRIKIGQFVHNELIQFQAFTLKEEAQAAAYVTKLASGSVIYVQVSDRCPKLVRLLRTRHAVPFTTAMDMPFSVKYKNLSSLGPDRLAAALGAYSVNAEVSWLIINLGSCITIDFLHNRLGFLGGNISPGWQMRVRAMHRFTASLPLVNLPPLRPNGLGASTEEAIQLGATLGVIHELKGYIKFYQTKHKRLQCVLSGGDAAYFENQLERTIFAEPYLVLKGLNYFLTHL